ncbi:MAG: hypothetical protein KDH94_03385, partial [Coxiellaceae bacterium]|nr:hypothetical protein [Coxiellaceae bacterium]
MSRHNFLAFDNQKHYLNIRDLRDHSKANLKVLNVTWYFSLHTAFIPTESKYVGHIIALARLIQDVEDHKVDCGKLSKTDVLQTLNKLLVEFCKAELLTADLSRQTIIGDVIAYKSLCLLSFAKQCLAGLSEDNIHRATFKTSLVQLELPYEKTPPIEEEATLAEGEQTPPASPEDDDVPAPPLKRMKSGLFSLNGRSRS